MAKNSDLLLDTHILIWLASDPERLALSLLRKIEDANRRYVSHMSALEIQIKNGKNPKLFEFSFSDFERSMKEFSLDELPLNIEDIKAFGSMRFLHRDPFDRLLMTQAATRNLDLVTQDVDISRTAKRFKAFRVIGA